MSNTIAPNSTQQMHKWKFFRAGGVDQVDLRDGSDILQLPQLDQKLWVALACPTRGLEFSNRTLDLLDGDHDGRIRVPEVLDAVAWISSILKNLDSLLTGSDALPLSVLNEKTEAGAAILAGAKRILQNLGKPNASSITLADIADTATIFAGTHFNGDGIVPADSATETPIRQAIEEIIATLGAVADRSGKPGVDQAKVAAFFAQAASFITWQSEPDSNKVLLPLGDATTAAALALAAVQAKIDDYFTRCRLAAFDRRMTEVLNGPEADWAAWASKSLNAQAEEIARLPLARVAGGQPLPLREGLNPAWTDQIRGFAAACVLPLLGERTSLTQSEWESLKSALAPYQEWMVRKPTTAVESLGLPRLQSLLSSNAQAAITDLIRRDAALAAENAQIANIEKAILFYRDLGRFLKNFVNFSEFYSKQAAVFQAGTLYLDGRSCRLCLSVADAAKHGALAGLSAAYLAYCDCTRPSGEKMTIVAAFTDGDSDHLMVGRNGVFYDRKGRDWDATIAKVVANPISLREAFWAPYKKFVRMIEDQIAKRAAAADTQSQGKLTNVATALAGADKTKAPAPGEMRKVDVGTVAAIGVAIGGIGAMVTGVLSAFFGLGAWMPIGLVALLLLISGPSMLLAYLKLRQRNLGPMLDANGWAINGRARINVPFGAALTDVASLPPAAQRSLDDPYAQKEQPWGFYLVCAVVLLLTLGWYLGRVDGWLPGVAKSTSVLGTNAPAFQPAPSQPAATDNKK
jgi:hypothetical protein